QTPMAWHRSADVLFAAADTGLARVFIELGAAVLGLAVLTRLAHRLGFSAISLYLLDRAVAADRVVRSPQPRGSALPSPAFPATRKLPASHSAGILGAGVAALAGLPERRPAKAGPPTQRIPTEQQRVRVGHRRPRLTGPGHGPGAGASAPRYSIQ